MNEPPGMRSNSLLRFCTLALAAVLLAHGQSRFHATLATEDGSPLPGTPQIIPELSQSLSENCRILTMFGDGTVEYIVDWRFRQYDAASADACSVTIRLKGYRPTGATLRNGATIVLKRIGDSEGSMVSMTALKAPAPAKKAFGKGVVAMTDQKWAVAQKNFERAVEIYPDYAAAWSDLGLVFKEQSNPKEARAAWERAVQADPKYVKPYLQLAKLALEERRMEDAANIAERALAMNPTEFPAIYYYDAAANFNLSRFDASEKSVRRAIELDTNHEMPRAEFLLGTVLAAKGDRSGAVQHMRKYLEISPKAKDAAEVNRLIAKIESGPGEAK
jgi:tetratricopeptide (TPR) repeat protein